MQVEFLSTNPKKTEDFAEKFGNNLRGGECIEFKSDLGGGKTTFVRGLAKGVGSTDSVSSPTFTISQQYNSDSITIQHFDFYRLTEPGLVAEELSEALDNKNNIVIVEWANTVENVLPKDRVVISIEKDSTDELKRKYILNIPNSFNYLKEGIVS